MTTDPLPAYLEEYREHIDKLVTERVNAAMSAVVSAGPGSLPEAIRAQVYQRPDGTWWRKIAPARAGGSHRERPVNFVSLDDARAKREDFWHHQFGWVQEGYNLERDRDTDNILADNSMSVFAPDPVQGQEPHKE